MFNSLHVSWASCPLKLQKYLLSSSGPMYVCDVFWLRSHVWCNVRTWDYFECHAGVSQEIVQGVFLMIILSPQLRLHTDSSSIYATLSTHFGFWIPAVSCWDLLDWMKKYESVLSSVNLNELISNSNLVTVFTLPVHTQTSQLWGPSGPPHHWSQWRWASLE